MDADNCCMTLEADVKKLVATIVNFDVVAELKTISWVAFLVIEDGNNSVTPSMVLFLLSLLHCMLIGVIIEEMIKAS